MGEKVSSHAWKQHRIHTRARELLEEHPPRDMVPFRKMIQEVIFTRREMNRIKRSRYR